MRINARLSMLAAFIAALNMGGHIYLAVVDSVWWLLSALAFTVMTVFCVVLAAAYRHQLTH